MDEKDYDEPAEKEELDDAESDEDNEIMDNVDGDEEQDADDEVDVLKEHSLAKNYDYDRDNYLWCQIVFDVRELFFFCISDIFFLHFRHFFLIYL